MSGKFKFEWQLISLNSNAYCHLLYLCWQKQSNSIVWTYRSFLKSHQNGGWTVNYVRLPDGKYPFIKIFQFLHIFPNCWFQVFFINFIQMNVPFTELCLQLISIFIKFLLILQLYLNYKKLFHTDFVSKTF